MLHRLSHPVIRADYALPYREPACVCWIYAGAETVIPLVSSAVTKSVPETARRRGSSGRAQENAERSLPEMKPVAAPG